jgi:hypothetical protein
MIALFYAFQNLSAQRVLRFIVGYNIPSESIQKTCQGMQHPNTLIWFVLFHVSHGKFALRKVKRIDNSLQKSIRQPGGWDC